MCFDARTCAMCFYPASRKNIYKLLSPAAVRLSFRPSKSHTKRKIQVETQNMSCCCFDLLWPKPNLFCKQLYTLWCLNIQSNPEGKPKGQGGLGGVQQSMKHCAKNQGTPGPSAWSACSALSPCMKTQRGGMFR